MFRDRTNTIATLVLGAAFAYVGFRFLRWGVVNAIWSLPPDAGSQACRDARGEGACWAVVGERFRFILFGTYPFAEQWRPALACLLFVTLYGGEHATVVVEPAAVRPVDCSAGRCLRTCCAAGCPDSRTSRASSGADCR